jgi:hypothetical protein
MLSPEERQAVSGVTRTLQIIVGALIAGVITFLLVVVFATQPADGDRPANLALIGVAFAVVAAVAAASAPRLMAAQSRSALVTGRPASGAAPGNLPAGDAGMLLGGFQVRRIIAAAILEGAAFFNVFAYQTERQTYTLGIIAALLCGLLALIPLRPLVEQWLERELRTIKELRDLQR